MNRFISFWRILKLGWLNFWRNIWLSVAATAIVALTLFIISVFFVQNVVINQTTEQIKEKIDLKIYFEEGISDEQISELKTAIVGREDIKEIKYVSKEEAYQRWLRKENIPERIKKLISLQDNPLRRSLEIKATHPEKLESIFTFVSSEKFKPLIARISYQENKDVIEKIIQSSSKIKKNGLILGGIFLGISILIVLNTIRVIIYARKEEIEIMKLVGATDWFVRLPFILEGVIYGSLGCILAFLFLYLYLYYDLASATPLMGIAGYLAPDMFVFFRSKVITIFLSLLGLGITLGIICGLLSIRKYLKI